MTSTTPKAFISYSQSSPGHCDLIRTYAERLVNDGVDVTLDQWSLSEGQDKYAFMEKMVTDPSVSHVIIFSDQGYASKADARKAGVGTESQIISKQVYDRVDQKKFIPVVCQRKEDGEPYLPTFLTSRIWIDFSSDEKVNENWERLLRALYGKPIYEKPAIGKPPSYLATTERRPALPTIGKFNSLRQAILEGKPTAQFCRNDFLDAAMAYADSLRVRQRPDIEHLDKKVLQDVHALLPLRDQLIDWLLMEATVTRPQALEPVVTNFLERILALRYKPVELSSYNESWLDAHRIFSYEAFLYTIAALLKAEQFGIVHEALTTHYVLPPEANQGESFATFSEFYTHSEVLERRNQQLNPRRVSPLGDLLKDRASHAALPFRDVVQADLAVFLASILSQRDRWYPHTLVHARGPDSFPLFVRAAQHKHWSKLKIIYDVASGEDFRHRLTDGWTRHGVNSWSDFRFHMAGSLSCLVNLDALDTLT